LAVWGAPERNPWLTIIAGILVEHGHVPPPEPGTPSPFSMGTDERARGLLADAGFTAVRTDEVPVRFGFRDVDDYVSYATDTAGPFALVLAGLSEDERGAICGQLEEAFAPFVLDGGYELPGLALNAVAS
jgi:enediyne biosynthesis protein CalE5